jgi:hypothetical protein
MAKTMLDCMWAEPLSGAGVAPRSAIKSFDHWWNKQVGNNPET